MRHVTNEKIDPLTRIQEEIKEVVRREQEYRQLTSVASPTTEDDNISNEHSDVLTLAANSKQISLDDQHSDDSGFSASSSPINGAPCNGNISSSATNKDVSKSTFIKEQRYIGPNCYNITPEPPQQKLMTRTVSTPQLAIPKSLQFGYSPTRKGVMQRFIASRGKLQINGNVAGSHSAGSSPINATSATFPNSPIITPADYNITDSASIIIPTVSMVQTNIERDADGKPIRPGYIPVEVKIQREIKDLHKRESELKKIRKIRKSTPDLLDSIDNEHLETDDEDGHVEHCYGPGQLRNAKSISELCDSAQSNNSISPRTTPSPYFDNNVNHIRGNGMRPAMSLAQLCDLDPEEAPSSHRLIAQWESLIQQNA